MDDYRFLNISDNVSSSTQPSPVAMGCHCLNVDASALDSPGKAGVDGLIQDGNRRWTVDFSGEN